MLKHRNSATTNIVNILPKKPTAPTPTCTPPTVMAFENPFQIHEVEVQTNLEDYSEVHNSPLSLTDKSGSETDNDGHLSDLVNLSHDLIN